MRITRIIPIPLIGVLVILGACSPVPEIAPPPPVAIAPAPTVASVPKPAAFSTSNLTIRPYTVETASETQIGVTVTNTGGLEGTYTVVLKIDGAITKTQDITLAGGMSEHVVLTIPLVNWFTAHVVSIDQLTGELPIPDPDAH